MKLTPHILLATSLLGCISANAEATGLLVGKLTGETAFDRAWSGFTLYKNDDNQILQEFSLQGRLQVQTMFGEDKDLTQSFNTSEYKDASSLGVNNDENVWGNDIEARRARFGFKSKWYQNWKFEGQINVDNDGHDGGNDASYYKDLYDLYITYVQSDALNVSVGKTKVKFSKEQEISSKEILTIERSLVSNTLFPGELTGIWANGKGIADYWLYEVGVYGSDRVREFSSFHQGTVFLGKIGYDYSSQAGFDSAVAALHYMHNTQPGYRPQKSREYIAGESPDFTDSIALTNDITQGRFGLTTEMLYGVGFKGRAERHSSTGPAFTYSNRAVDQSDVIALSMIPSYYIADGLQLVGRLQVASSDDADDLRVPSRYERLGGPGDTNERGNTYTSAYLGLNYYMYGHKLKLMNGVEYSKMGGGGYEGYTLQSSLRFSF